MKIRLHRCALVRGGPGARQSVRDVGLPQDLEGEDTKVARSRSSATNAKQTIAPEVDQLEEKRCHAAAANGAPFCRTKSHPSRGGNSCGMRTCEPDSPQRQAFQVTCSHLYMGEKELAGEFATEIEPSSFRLRVSSQVQIAVLRLVPPEIWT